MVSQKVKTFIEDHSFCSEYLFKDWETFLDILYAEGGAISCIQWWDHCTKSEQHRSIGSGGYADPENPEYLFAETQLFEDGFETKSLDEIKKHIAERRNAKICYHNRYISFDLVPSFYLVNENIPFAEKTR